MSDNLINHWEKENLKSILESLPISSFITDRSGKLKFYNSATVQLLGSEPELDTDRWYGNATLYHPDGTPVNSDEDLVSLFLNKQSNSGDGDLLIAERRDGERIWFKAYSSELNNEEGERVGAINMLVDFTGQKEVERQLRKNEAELLEFFDNTAVGLHQTGADGVIKRANKAILDMLGYSREEFVGSNIKDFHVDPKVLNNILEKLSAGEKIHDYEIQLRHKDGSIRQVLLKSDGYWQGGEFVHSQCITRDITERKQVRAELKNITAKFNQKERLYEAIISSTTDLIYVFDLDYRFIFANDALLEMWGLTEDEYFGKGLREIGYEKWHAEMHEREIDQVIATKEPVQGEVTFPHAKLGKRFYDYLFVPVIDSEGNVEAVAGTTRDITRRREAEEALRRNEEKYRTLVENFPNGAVGLFDKDLKYTAVGGDLVEAEGIDLNDRIDVKITDIYPDDILDKVEPYFHAALDGEMNSFEVKYHGRQLVAKTLPVNDDDGKIMAGMLVVLDISERWQAQQELQKSEEKYRSLFESMDEGFAVIQMEFDENNEPVNFRFLETNPAYQRHTGLEQNVEGKTAKEVFPDLGEDMLRRDGEVALTGEPFHDEIYVDEVDRWLDLSAFRIGEPEERKVAVIFTDITERKRAQHELELMNQTLEERVEERTQSLLSYQDKLRSLAFQLSRTEEKERQQLATDLHDNLGQLLALGKMKINEVQKELSKETTPAVDELNELLDDAIRYTRELTSDLKPPPSVSNDIIASLNWLSEKMEKRGLAVTIDDDKLTKPLDGEIRAIIVQSVRELLFNVIKHTSEQEATVRLRRGEEQLQVTVEDDGEGFDLENKELVSLKDDKFGLFNIQERINLLGGRVDIYTEIGRGTKVTLYVPLSKASNGRKGVLQTKKDVQINKERPRQIKHGEVTKILLVDDHKMFRNGLRKIIDEENDMLIVGEAGNGEEAVTLSRERSPDVILMDVSMPKMDGIEATELIKTDLPGVRIIGVSLHDSQEIREDMLGAGASAYLPKTEAFESLILTIRAEASATDE